MRLVAMVLALTSDCFGKLMVSVRVALSHRFSSIHKAACRKGYHFLVHAVDCHRQASQGLPRVISVGYMMPRANIESYDTTEDLRPHLSAEDTHYTLSKDIDCLLSTPTPAP